MTEKKKIHWLSAIAAIAIVPLVHYGLQFYNNSSEVKDFTYGALNQALDEHSEDDRLEGMIRSAMKDGEIISNEFIPIADYIMAEYSVYKSAPIDADYSNAKSKLLASLK